MRKVPVWFWPAAFTPAGACGVLVFLFFLEAHTGRVRLQPNLATLAMAGSVYLALVLLAYLILLLCAKTPPTPREEPS